MSSPTAQLAGRLPKFLGRARCPQAGAAGTKGQSNPPPRSPPRPRSSAPLVSVTRTICCACTKNLRENDRFSAICIQRAAQIGGHGEIPPFLERSWRAGDLSPCGRFGKAGSGPCLLRFVRSAAVSAAAAPTLAARPKSMDASVPFSPLRLRQPRSVLGPSRRASSLLALRWRIKTALSCLALCLLSQSWALEKVEADICIYGGTAAGVAAAVQATCMGKKAVI